MRHHLEILNEMRWGCPCGARAEEPYGLCRKCRARAIWRRRTALARRIARRGRRRGDRRAA
jgi:hypothetical protein